MENTLEMFWKNVKSLLKAAAPWPLICYFGLITSFFIKGFNIVSGLGELLLGALSVILLPAFFVSFFKSKLLRKTFLSFFYFFYIFLGIYRLTIKRPFDYKLFIDNLNILFYWESTETIGDRVSSMDIALLLGLIFIVLLFAVFKNNKINEPVPLKKTFSILIFSLYIGLLYIPKNKLDEVGLVVKDMVSFYGRPMKIGEKGEKTLKKEYPFLKLKEGQSPKGELPHIFIIPIESFNANFVGVKNENGMEYTPFFNSLIKKGIFVDHFYGGSIQTAKGIFSILCSMVPKKHGKVFEKHADINFRCLPEILEEHGYTNLYYQSYRDINFDNTKIFLKNNNFKVVESLNEEELTEREKEENVWGWGPQDDLLYKYVFKRLDKKWEKQLEKKGNKPFFVTLQGISSHMTFQWVPKDQRYLYKENKTKKQSFANAIRVVDQYLKTFFNELKKRDYLKNSIVVITGDHSFPNGEHKIYHNETGFYEEFFRVPLLILPGVHHNPLRIKGKSYSQVDIAPTLLDLTNIQTSHSFQGSSILKGKKTYQFLVQPYSGTFLGVVDYPFKYVFHEKTGKEFLFNLKTDPRENTNLLSLSKMDKKIELIASNLRGEKDLFYVNDFIIEQNRVWKEAQ